MRVAALPTGIGAGSAAASRSAAGWLGLRARQRAASLPPVSEAPRALPSSAPRSSQPLMVASWRGRGIEPHATFARLAQQCQQAVAPVAADARVGGQLLGGHFRAHAVHRPWRAPWRCACARPGSVGRWRRVGSARPLILVQACCAWPLASVTSASSIRRHTACSAVSAPALAPNALTRRPASPLRPASSHSDAACSRSVAASAGVAPAASVSYRPAACA